MAEEACMCRHWWNGADAMIVPECEIHGYLLDQEPDEDETE